MGINKLCFTSCLDVGFIPGAEGLIKSIRKFYSKEQADIVMFINGHYENFEQFCVDSDVSIHYFEEMERWILSEIYGKEPYVNNSNHYYHKDFIPHPEIPYPVDKMRETGFHKIRHSEAFHAKSYCMAYTILIKEYSNVVFIDCDAFLLAPLDEIFDEYTENDSIIGFDDGLDKLNSIEPLYGVKKPLDWSDELYAFNAGVVFYVNGPSVKSLIKDLCFYTDSIYHFEKSGFPGDQGLLRALVAVYSIRRQIHYHLLPASNWNPSFRRADYLEYKESKGTWINKCNGLPQRIWHGAGSVKLWTGQYDSPSVNAAWDWINGDSLVWRPYLKEDHLQASPKLRLVIDRILSHVYSYVRVGHDERQMSFLENGQIGCGKMAMEQFWNVREDEDIYIEIHSGKVKICRLYLNPDGTWKGHWRYFEKMEVRIIQIDNNRCI